ncbi:type II secretion system major pseudopilin GspG [Aliikangiella sp. IMCC44359]|uniref:type II secretion system major pseudopilin GspG n=1 Tax=Aliikangiella sp. IMCC44359 TaxID=3459125 RepID=UPI00403B347E
MKIKTRFQSGFSWLKILLAIVFIMVILGSILANSFVCDMEYSLFQRVKGDLAVLDSAIIQYHSDNSLLPTKEQGLESLVTKPDVSPIPENYSQRGYLKQLKSDPWGNEYQYRYPGKFGDYDIYSLGSDGELGGKGTAADLGNWNIDDAIAALKN